MQVFFLFCRIQNKEAEALLSESEKAAAEAFEAATAMGVIMYDTPNCPQKHCQIEPSAENREVSTTHTITASFETAFEVDKEVAAAVKAAFIRLANCSSFSKDEFRDLLHKISENPDTNDSNKEISGFSSECETESGSELETVSQNTGSGSQDLDLKMPVNGMRQRKSKRRQSSDKFSMTKLIEMMLERLSRLQEDELSSLATIVATCGLNAALAKVENCKMHYSSSATDSSTSALNPQRMSSLGAGAAKKTNLDYFMDVPAIRKHTDSELPSLEKFLVKHMSKLEREVQEAKNSRINESRKTTGEYPGRVEHGLVKLQNETSQSEADSDLGSVLVKRSSKFMKEIEEAKNNPGNKLEIIHKNLEIGGMPNQVVSRQNEDVQDVPSLDKYLVKHVSRLEKEVQEARSRRNNDPVQSRVTDSTEKKSLTSVPKSEKSEISSSTTVVGKENFDLNKEDARFSENDSLDKILVKPVHRLEREKMQALSEGNTYGYNRSEKKQIGNSVTDCDSLDKVLVKHVSRLEKEKMMSNASKEIVKVKRNTHSSMNEEEVSLDKVLVKHKSRLEREKVAAAAAEEPEVPVRSSVSRREARERELQEAWGGLSLGNSIRPHLSKLEREKVISPHSCFLCFWLAFSCRSIK